ncbi:MAG: hypothetical protein IJK59_09465 [Firmicutes bacterium]|nr:hypothetical protein [Bacillota bacterium]MBQ6261463.1 hypothetical protein [Bacillota bacterium]
MKRMTKRELRTACSLYAASFEQALPDPSLYAVRPSDASFARMQPVLENAGRLSPGPALRRLAAAAAVVVICFSSWFTADAGAREKIITWTKEIYENTISYKLEGDGDNGELYTYELGWVPRGFKEVRRHRNSDFSETVYRNEKSREVIVFAYYGQTEYAPVSVISIEEREAESGTFLNYYYEMYMADEHSSTYDTIFIDTDNEMVFAISTNRDKETAFKLIKKMKRFKK